MPTIRERIVKRVLRPELEQMDNQMRTMWEAYLRGPFEELTTPDALLARLREQTPDEAIIRDLIDRIYYENIGSLTGYGKDSDAQRTRAVDESRRQWRLDVIAQDVVWIWTNFGFGEDIIIRTEDESAQKVWDEFWTADRNHGVLASDEIQDLSYNTLVDGEVFLAFYISDADGTATVRIVNPKEITAIVTSKDDAETPLFYKRVWNSAGATDELYYEDWLAAFNSKPDTDRVDDQGMRKIGGVPTDVLPKGAKVAGEKMTKVVMLHIAHNRKGGLRGWPLMTAGAAWTREHKRFRENRAAVSAATAMYVNKLKAQTGSRGISALKAQIQSSMVTSGQTYDTNPPAPAGSTWLENEAVDLERLGQGTAAGDAKVDGEGLLMMAGLGGGLYPHYLGAGDAYRLATACYSEDTEVLTENGWKSWRDWSPGEKIATYNHGLKHLEYQQPTKLHVYDYDGEMVSIQGRTTDALVTPNHRMLVLNENNQSKKWAKTEFEVMEAGSLPSRFALPSLAGVSPRDEIDVFELPGHSWTAGMGLERMVPSRLIPMDDWLEFLGWWLAEGSLHKSKKRPYYGVSLCQSASSPDIERIRALLLRLPIKFCEGLYNDGDGIRWRVNDKALFNWLKDNCGKGAKNKHLPRFAFSLCRRQTRILLDAIWDGDGHWTNDTHYRGFLTSTSYQLIEECQVLMLHLGEWGKIALNRAANAHKLFKKTPACWLLHRNQRSKLSLARKRNVSMVAYRGKVWCFEAPPNKMFITRRNGCPLIAGNTAMESPIFRQFSRYQSFWAAQFRKIVRIVLEAYSTLMGVEFANYKAVVSTDRLVEADLQVVSGSIHQVIHAIFVPAIEAGLMPKEVAQKILAALWRIVLEALQVQNAVDIASDEEFMKSGDPVMQVAQAVQRNVQEGVIPEGKAFDWAMRELKFAQERLDTLK